MKRFNSEIFYNLGKVSGEVMKEVERIRSELDSATLLEAVTTMDDMKVARESLGAIKAELEKLNDTLRFGVVPDRMTDMDVTTVTFDGIGRVTVQDDVQLSITDSDILKAWLTDNGFEDMITASVHSGTLAAFVRRRLREGKDLPTQAVKIRPITRASITKV